MRAFSWQKTVRHGQRCRQEQVRGDTRRLSWRRLLPVLLMALSLLVTKGSGCAGTQEKSITLDDAPDILDLSDYLPDRFAHVEAWRLQLSKENVGLGPDASEVEVFLSQEPYQLLYFFIRVVESVEEQDRAMDAIYDSQGVETTMKPYIEQAARRQDVESVSPRIEVFYPAIAGGAVLGQGRADLGEYDLHFDMLWFRSESPRAFVYLYSWYTAAEEELGPPLDTVSLISVAREVGLRIEERTE